MTALERVVMAGTKSDSTKRTYASSVRVYAGFAGADPARWTPASVELWRDSMLANKLTVGTVNGRLRALKYASKRYAALGHGPDFAAVAETMPDESVSTRHAITLEQTRKLVAACAGSTPKDLRDRAMIVLGLRTGLRREALVTAAVDKLDGPRLTVRDKGRGRSRFHTVVLDKVALAALNPWRDWLASQNVRGGALFRSIRRPDIEGRQRVGKAGLTASSFWKIVSDRAKLAGLPHVHPHILRHTFASLALAGGERPERVAKALNHRKLDQIMRYMTDLQIDDNPVGGNLPEM